MLAAAIPVADGFVTATFDDDGSVLRTAEKVSPSDLELIERRSRPRWLFDSATAGYPAMLAAGLRVRRCHDIELTERILLGRMGRFGEPCRAAAVVARATGRPVPADPLRHDAGPASRAPEQPGLFQRDVPVGPPPSPADLLRAYLDQQQRIPDAAAGTSARDAGIDVPVGALRLLIAAESGSALAAAEMSFRGLPWDVAVHQAVLAEALGPRPLPGQRPARMAGLAVTINEAFGFAVNPDSPLDLRNAFRRSGFDIDTTRAWTLRRLEHPAVGPVLKYKELARLYSANGWNWLADWVSGGRLTCQYLPGGVVSGRWAARGGGGLQLPQAIRRAAIALPGYRLVVADAAQLEPRVWAAVSRDDALAAVSADADLYAALAADGFGGDRRHTKVAMLGAMYGQSTGEAARLMATLRVRYPVAVGYVEAAARRGEIGAVVASVLGRACPPPTERWGRLVGGDGDDGASWDGEDRYEEGDRSAAEPVVIRRGAQRRAWRAARDRGRFTRNFVIQASAADWAAGWLSGLRLDLLDVPGSEMVFFQHDELIVHAPTADADRICELIVHAADSATARVFPGSAVRIPVRPAVVTCYADAK